MERRPQEVVLPITILSAPYSDELAKEIAESWRFRDGENLHHEGRIGTLTYFVSSRLNFPVLPMLAGMIFGSIHILGWGFGFPTTIEPHYVEFAQLRPRPYLLLCM
jgi:hypothetical protein